MLRYRDLAAEGLPIRAVHQWEATLQGVLRDLEPHSSPADSSSRGQGKSPLAFAPFVVDPQVLEKLQGLGREQLKEALTDLCRPFGQVKRMEMHSDGKGGFICLVDLASLGETAAVCRQLGAFTFGHSAGFRIPAKGDKA